MLADGLPFLVPVGILLSRIIAGCSPVSPAGGGIWMNAHRGNGPRRP
jgi:hypothetical protein